MGMMAKRNCWGRFSLGLKQILSASYFFAVILLCCTGSCGYVVIYDVGKGLYWVWEEIVLRGVFVSFFLFGRGLIVGEVGVPRFLFVVIGQGGLLDSCQKIYHFWGRDHIRGKRSGDRLLILVLMGPFLILSVLGFWFSGSDFEKIWGF